MDKAKSHTQKTAGQGLHALAGPEAEARCKRQKSPKKRPKSAKKRQKSPKKRQKSPKKTYP